MLGLFLSFLPILIIHFIATLLKAIVTIWFTRSWSELVAGYIVEVKFCWIVQSFLLAEYANLNVSNAFSSFRSFSEASTALHFFNGIIPTRCFLIFIKMFVVYYLILTCSGVIATISLWSVNGTSAVYCITISVILWSFIIIFWVWILHKNF